MKRTMIFFVLLIIVFFVLQSTSLFVMYHTIAVSFGIEMTGTRTFQVYYAIEENEGFSEDKSVCASAVESGKRRSTISLELPVQAVTGLRIDFGTEKGTMILSNLTIKKGRSAQQINLVHEAPLLNQMTLDSDGFTSVVTSLGSDPFIHMGNYRFGQDIPDSGLNLGLCLLASVLLTVIVWLGMHAILRIVAVNDIKPRDAFLTAAFMLILLVPMVTRDNFDVDKEYRYPAEMPVSWSLDFPSKFESWFNDHFGLRNWLSSTYAKINYFAFDYLPTQIVRVGKNGWLFYTNPNDGDKIEAFQNVVLYTNDELEQIKDYQVSVYDVLQARGIPYVILVAPNKNTIYPEQYISGVQKATETSRLDQVIAYLSEHTNIHIVDVRQRLWANKETVTLYISSDAHWNSFGAFLAYQELIERISPLFDGLIPLHVSNFEITEDHSYVGDLIRPANIDPDDYKGTVDVYHFSPVEPYQYTGLTGDNDVTTIIEGTSLPCALIYHDSFFLAMRPFLSTHFRQATYRRAPLKYEVLLQDLESIQADVVIFEFVERFEAWHGEWP